MNLTDRAHVKLFLYYEENKNVSNSPDGSELPCSADSGSEGVKDEKGCAPIIKKGTPMEFPFTL
jgi:hypothetical protein